MKKIKKIVIYLLTIISILFCIKQIVPSLKLDGYSGLLLNILLLTDDTKYSENYTGRKFLKVKKGMTKQEVINILGDPLAEWESEENIERLEYSESPKDTHYRIRQVYLKNNIVTERISYFYVD